MDPVKDKSKFGGTKDVTKSNIDAFKNVDAVQIRQKMDSDWFPSIKTDNFD